MIKVENLGKPDNKKWKKIADIALYTLPLYDAVVLGMPIPDLYKSWIITVLNTTVVIFKGVSKFTSDEESV